MGDGCLTTQWYSTISMVCNSDDGWAPRTRCSSLRPLPGGRGPTAANRPVTNTSTGWPAIAYREAILNFSASRLPRCNCGLPQDVACVQSSGESIEGEAATLFSLRCISSSRMLSTSTRPRFVMRSCSVPGAPASLPPKGGNDRPCQPSLLISDDDKQK